MSPTIAAWLLLLGANPTTPAPTTPESLWDALAHTEAAVFHKQFIESTFPSDQLLPLLGERLRPVPPAETAVIRGHITALDDPSFRRRQDATRALMRIGEPAADQLTTMLDGPVSAEARHRAEYVLGIIGRSPIDPRRLRNIRGLELLERIGNPQARAILKRLAQGDTEAELTQLAHAALVRLEPDQSNPREWIGARAHPDHPTFTGHTSTINAVAFNHDGSRIASASSDRSTRLWDTETGRELFCLKGHEQAIYAVAFSPDGRTLATGGGDKMVRLWDAATGEERMILAGHTDAVRAIAFSPDGQILASSGSDHGIRLWRMPDGKPHMVLTGHTASIRAIDFSPDGYTLASCGSDKSIRIWETASGGQRQILEGHTSSVRAIRFGASGRTLASVSLDNSARIWDMTTGTIRHIFTKHTGNVYAVALSPDEALVTTAGLDRSVRIWNVSNAEPLATLTDPTATIYTADFSPNGRHFVIAGSDKQVRLYEMIEAGADQP